MGQEQQEAGGKPKFLSGVNGIIAGLTGLVIALGGLVTAYKAMTDDKSEAQQAVAPQPSEPAPAPREEQPASRPTLYKGDLYEDGAFNGGGVLFEKEGDVWTVTEGDDSYEYDELATTDKSHVVAVSGPSTLRWPVNGGVVEESEEDRRDRWKTYARVDPDTVRP
jgi:hypothetical protein